MNSFVRSSLVLSFRKSILAGAFLAGGVTAHAGSATWSGATDATWTNPGNWTGGTPGNLSTGTTTTSDVAMFNSNPANGTTTALSIDSGRTIGGLTFTGAAGAFVIGTTGGNSLYLSNGGTTQIDGSLSSTNKTQTINAPLVVAGANAAYTFQNNSANGTGAGAGTLSVGAISGGTAGATTITLAGSNSNANAVNGIISNGSATSVAISKSGLGNWTLAGANTYSGGTTITSGTLISLNTTLTATTVVPTNLGSGTVNVNGGTLLLGANTTSLATYDYSNNFSINGGTIEANQGAVGLGPKLTPGTVTIGSGGAVIGSLFNSNGSGAPNRQAVLIYSSISGSGPMTVEYLGNSSAAASTGNGSLVRIVNTTNSYSGTLTVVGGTNNPNGGATVGLAGTYLLIDGGSSAIANASLNLNGDNVAGGTFSSAVGTSTLAVLNGTSALSIAGLSGNGSINMTTVGGSPNGYTLTVGNTSSNLSTVYSGTMQNGSTGFGALIKDGTGTLTLTGANTYTGATTITNGSLQLGNGGTTGRLPGASASTLIDNGNLAVDRSDSVSQSAANIFTSSAITGSGSITQMGSGTLTLTAANTYTGALILNNGTVNAATTNINGTNTTNGIVFNGGTLQSATGTITTAKAVSMTGAGTFDSNGTISTLSGNITGSGGALTKAGTGTLVLGGSGNTFSAGLTINNGTVQDGNANSGVLGSGNVTFGTSNTPTLDLNGNSATVGLIAGAGTNGVITNNVTGTSRLTLAGSGTQTYGGVLQNGGSGKIVALTMAGTGTQTLTGANTYSGGTKISSGALYANNLSGSATGTGTVTVLNGATLAGNGTIAPGAGNGITLASGSTLKSGITETGSTVTGRLTLDNTTAATKILDASLGNVTLAFNLGAGNDGLSTPTPNAMSFDFANPNIDSSYLKVNGSTAGEIAFNGTNANDIISLTDLTTGTLQLIQHTPYLLISAYSNAAYTGLVTTGVTVGGVVGDGYVENLSLSISGGDYPGARLYLYHGDLEVVPEPGTWAMMLGGLAVLVFLQRRRRNSDLVPGKSSPPTALNRKAKGWRSSAYPRTVPPLRQPQRG